MYFHGLIALFVLLLLSNIPSSGCTIVYLSIYLVKDTLVAYKFWQLCRILCFAPLYKYQRAEIRSYGKSMLSFV